MDLDALATRFGKIAPHVDTLATIAANWPALEEMLGVFAKMKAERAQYQEEREAEDRAIDAIEQGASETAQIDAPIENVGTTQPAPDVSAPSTENPAPPPQS